MEENLSKALIMMAEVLIGILLLTVMAYAFAAGRDFSATINANIEQKTIAEFNAKFEVYNSRSNLTAQDVVTLANLVHDYNTNEHTAETIELQIKGIEKSYRDQLQRGPTKDEAIVFMQSYAPYMQEGEAIKRNFKCDFGYDDNGRIHEIKIERIS